MEKLRFAILGAGCGGQSMAAILENQGCAVTLMDKNEALVQELKQEEKLTLTGKIELTAPMPACVTTDAAEAIDGADVILVVTTADGRADRGSEPRYVLRRACLPDGAFPLRLPA